MKQVLYILVLLAALTARGWCGSVVTVSGQAVMISSAPESLLPGADEDDSAATLFLEQNDLSFSSGIMVDATLPGVYSSLGNLTSGVIAAGTPIYDTYFHADPAADRNVIFNGSLTFGSPILGVIFQSSTLDATDSLLGDEGTVYATGDTRRGLELIGIQDQFTISSDMQTLSFNVRAWNNLDEMRIITAAPSNNTGLAAEAPEPGSLLLVVAGLSGVVWFRRKTAATVLARPGR
jgi:hypothetical protein